MNAPRPVLTTSDADLALIRARTVAILGYGNQGHAHAQNLRDEGVRVLVGARPDGAGAARARADGFEVFDFAEAAHRADVLMLLVPDEQQPALYAAALAPALGRGKALAFGHGFALRFGLIVPPPEVDVLLVAPVGPGHLLRTRYLEGRGIPCLFAAHQDASGGARALALSYAAALGAGRAGMIESTVREECETDLFGEQAVICGGVTALITAGFETLVEAGYPEELAYFECAHQMKLLVDLIFARGVAGMREAISSTAKYGDVTRGPRVIDAGVKARMKEVLAEVQSGAFAEEWMREHQAGRPRLARLLAAAEQHPMEAVGARLRALTARGDETERR
jgi:ketol-acid reductoisomerase